MVETRGRDENRREKKGKREEKREDRLELKKKKLGDKKWRGKKYDETREK